METIEGHPVTLPISVAEYLDEWIQAPPGGTFYVDLDRGSVEVTEHEFDRIHVRADARGWGAHLVSFHLDRRGDDAELEVDIDSWLAALVPGTRVLVEIALPAGWSVDIRTAGGNVQVTGISGAVTAQTGGGSVSVHRVCGSARLRTSGGSIAVSELQGNLRAQTGGGSIRADDVAGRVEARTAGGSIRLITVDGPVEARTGGGSIKVSFEDEPEGRLETAGGSIEVTFPEDAGCDLDARTLSGNIRIDHRDVVTRERRRRHLVAQVNGGGPPLTLRTLAGSVRIRKS